MLLGVGVSRSGIHVRFYCRQQENNGQSNRDIKDQAEKGNDTTGDWLGRQTGSIQINRQKIRWARGGTKQSKVQHKRSVY